MHDIKAIESDVDSFKRNLGKRGFDISVIDEVILLNGKRKSLTTDVETAQSEVKLKSKGVSS